MPVHAFPPDFSPARIAPSPNHGERLARLDAVILHYTGMPTAEAALARLRDPDAQVSCHYLVHEDGGVDQLVPESRRAWHAGKSFWRGETDINSRSIGIEIVNRGHDGGLPPYPARQINSLIDLCGDILARRGISPARVLAHSDIAPGRKIDPGERFPWARLAAAGVALWTAPRRIRRGRTLGEGCEGEEVAALRRDLGRLGYDIAADGRFDATTRVAVASFQSRWRPSRVDGVADPATRATLADALALLRPPRSGRPPGRS